MLDLLFWLVVLTYIWYGRGEWRREKRLRAVQNWNNKKMETIR